jgi:hypothetical protein
MDMRDLSHTVREKGFANTTLHTWTKGSSGWLYGGYGGGRGSVGSAHGGVGPAAMGRPSSVGHSTAAHSGGAHR